MKYLWTEDTGAGLHFWQLVNQLFFEGKLIVESKESNQGILDAIYQLQPDTGDIYYIVFDYVVDNQDIRNKYRILRSFADRSAGHVIILDMICFEYLILAFDQLECWYRDCCVSDHKDHLRCGEPEVKTGDKKVMTLIMSDAVQHILKNIS